MSNEEMMAIAEKIKNQTASQEEIASFIEAFANLMGEIKDGLSA